MTKVEMVEAIKVLTNTIEVLVSKTNYEGDDLIRTIRDKIAEYVRML